MFDDEFGVGLLTGPENLLKLLECRERMYNDDSLKTILENIVRLELNAMYIDTWNACMPMIDKHNKAVDDKANKTSKVSKLTVIGGKPDE